jgi:hypothetical protein
MNNWLCGHFCIDIRVRFKDLYFFYFPILGYKILVKISPKNRKISWIYTRKEMNLEIHVFLIPNFCVENKIVGKQKTLVKLQVLQLYFPTYKQMHISWIIKRNHLKFTYIGISPLCIHPSFWLGVKV